MKTQIESKKKKEPPFELNKEMLENLGWIPEGRASWNSDYQSVPNQIRRNALYLFLDGDKLHCLDTQLRMHSFRRTPPDPDSESDWVIRSALHDYVPIEKYPTKSGSNGVGYVKVRSNAELFKRIIEMEAFGETYQRHFRINRLLK